MASLLLGLYRSRRGRRAKLGELGMQTDDTRNFLGGKALGIQMSMGDYPSAPIRVYIYSPEGARSAPGG